MLRWHLNCEVQSVLTVLCNNNNTRYITYYLWMDGFACTMAKVNLQISYTVFDSFPFIALWKATGEMFFDRNTNTH